MTMSTNRTTHSATAIVTSTLPVSSGSLRKCDFRFIMNLQVSAGHWGAGCRIASRNAHVVVEEQLHEARVVGSRVQQAAFLSQPRRDRDRQQHPTGSSTGAALNRSTVCPSTSFHFVFCEPVHASNRVDCKTRQVPRTRNTGPSTAQWVGISLFAIITLPVWIPVVALAWIWQLSRHVIIVAQMHITWPQSKRLLVAYSSGAASAEHIENELLPRLGDAAVVIDRAASDWKTRFPLEMRMLSLWAGLRINPVVIVRVPRYKIRVFALYDAFRAARKGRPWHLADAIDQIVVLSRLPIADHARRS